MVKYLTVGTSEITRERFIDIEDTEGANIKPRGGLWLTEYYDEHYNEWVDYLLGDSVALYYKSRGSSIWEQPCSLVTLNESANIYTLKDNEGLDFLKKNYPLHDDKFSYKAISNLYDGIYVDMYKLIKVADDDTRMRLYKFGVNSLILFNLDCINYYQSGIVDIEPFDFEYGDSEGTTYQIKCEDVKKRILKK
ncbi:MAG: hypothetical protein IKI04_03030 [Bacilli bacterium]|nr:hypothetical protein [Bacilli bacterium]